MSHVLRSNLFRFFVVFVACAALSLPVFAQSTVTGGIAGTIVDPQKAVVVDTKISIRNLGTNAQSAVNSDAQGKFRVVQLQPGTYEVIAEKAGFARTKVGSVVVEVGRITELEIALVINSKGETVEVGAEAPLVNTMQQDFTSNLSQDAIANMPINGRRWSNFALMTPGATPDGTFGLISFRGISGLLNNNTVDGGDNNQAFFSEERGRTRSSYTVSQSSIQEFQVNTSNYSAEYGRAAGGVVNSVTKSGSNKLHGEGFWYIRDNELGATNPFSTITVSDGNGGWKSVPYKAADRRQQFGGNLGGPIIKDKLFFFFNYDGQRRNFPGMAVFGTSNGVPTFLNAPSASEISTLASRLGGISTQAATDYFNAALKFVQAETGPVPRRGDQDIFFPKIDYRITPNNNFSVSYNRMRWNSPAGVQTQPTNTYGTNSFGNDYVKTDMLMARLSSAVSSNISNEFRYQWGRDFEIQASQPPSAAELNPCSVMGLTGVTTCRSLATSLISGDPRVPTISVSGAPTLGRPNFLERAAYPDETRHQFADTMNVSHGKHQIKFGFDIVRNNDAYSNLYRGGSEYSYSGTNARVNFVSDLLNYLVGNPTLATNWSNYYQAFGPLGIEFHTNDWAFFGQDDYRVMPRLTLSFGLRYEYEQIPKAIYPNTLVPETMQIHKDRNNFGPRFGFAYDMFGDGKTSLRGGYGLYYGRINNGAIGNSMFNSGATLNGALMGQASYSYGSGAVTFPNVAAAPPTGTVKPAIAYFDSKLQVPQIHQVDLVLEREVMKNTVVSLGYMLSLGRQLPQFIDDNIAPSTANISYLFQGGPFNGQTVTVPFYSKRKTGTPYSSYYNMMRISSSINSSYNALTAQFNRRMTNGLQFNMNYTWSHAIDDGQNSLTMTPSYQNVYDGYNAGLEHGTSSLDIRHRFVSSVVWQPQYFKRSSTLTKALLDGWNLAPLVTVSSGKPYTEGISGSLYLTPSGGFSTSSTGNSIANSGMNGAGGNYRLATMLGRNSFRYPNFANVDLRLSRMFRIAERHQLEFIAEAFNLMNSQQITGLNTTMYATGMVGAQPVLNFAGSSYASTYAAFGSFSAAGTNMYRERQVQFAVRYKF